MLQNILRTLLVVSMATSTHASIFAKASGPIHVLDPKTLNDNVLGGHHLWFVLFHDDEDASFDYVETYTEVAQEVEKYGVRVSAIDCTKYKKECGKFGVQQYPTLVAVDGKTSINPYTKKNLRNVRALSQRKTSQLKKWVTRSKGAKLPSWVVEGIGNTTTMDEYARRVAKRGLKSAVLITTKRKVSPILKGISANLKDRIEIAHVGGVDVEKELLERFQILMPPTKEEEKRVASMKPKAWVVEEEEEEEEKEKEEEEKEEEKDEEEINLDEDEDEEENKRNKQKKKKEKEQEEKKKRKEKRKKARERAQQKHAQAMKKYEEEKEKLDQLRSAATELPVIMILSDDGTTVSQTFQGDSSNIEALSTFFQQHATKEPVVALDAIPTKKEYLEVFDVKTHISIVDEGQFFFSFFLFFFYTNTPMDWIIS